MRATTVLRRLLALKQTRVLGVLFVAAGVIVDVAPTTRVSFCSGCGCRARDRYDHRLRRWRHLDLGGWRVWLRYAIWRVDCRRCGVMTELVPWAEHDSGFTRPFEQLVAFLAQRTDKTSVCALLRISWDTVGRIVQRVVARLAPPDRLAGLRRIGIDELSHRRHHEYVTIVTDHDRGEVVWSAPGKNADTVRSFFDDLGAERAAELEAVTIDMSGAYIEAVRERAPKAKLVFDRFHVQRLAHDALDQVRRWQVRNVREAGDAEGARAIKKTRFALQKRRWNLTHLERGKLAQVQHHNRALYRGYLLKDSLAEILDRRQQHIARDLLVDWIGWAQRSRLEPFAKVARTIKKYLDGIVAYVATGLSNGRAEGLNRKIRTITSRSYGLHDPYALIALIFLCCSNLEITPPHLPLAA